MLDHCHIAHAFLDEMLVVGFFGGFLVFKTYKIASVFLKNSAEELNLWGWKGWI